MAEKPQKPQNQDDHDDLVDLEDPSPRPLDPEALAAPVTVAGGGDWDLELEAWEASFPVLADSPEWAPSSRETAPPLPARAEPGWLPDPEAQGPLDTPSGEVFDLIGSFAPDSDSGAVGEGSGSHGSPAIERRATHLFEGVPPSEARPDFPTPTLPEMSAEPWAEDIHRLITLEDGAPGALRTPDPVYWEGLAQLLDDERQSASTDVAQLFELALAAARVAESRGRFDEARAHIDTAIASPGLSSGSGAMMAAHRARWCLAERTHTVNDDAVCDSLHRLAFMPHPDQSTYRGLRAEWTLGRVARGEVDATAAAQIAAIPDGLARSLAEAELVWNQPATAAAVLELAAHQAGGPVGAAWMEVAAALNESAGDFQAAAEQRGLRERLESTRGGAARFTIGSLADLARRAPVETIEALADLEHRLPPCPLKVAIARWGYRRARQCGNPGAATAFIFADEAGLGPPSAGLQRDRADDWASVSAVSDETEREPFERLWRALMEHWPEPEARLCLLWQSCARGVAVAGAPEPAVQSVLAALCDEALAGPGAHPDGAGALDDRRDDLLHDLGALSAVIEIVADDAVPDLDGQLQWLERWARIDPARRAVALAAEASAMARGDRPEREARRGELLRELARVAPTSLAGWQAAAHAAARGQFAQAADDLFAMSRSPAWRDSPAAVALSELAAERQAREQLDAVPAPRSSSASLRLSSSSALLSWGGKLGTMLGEGASPPVALALALTRGASLEELGPIGLAQPGPAGFWATVASSWAELAGHGTEALRLASLALAAPAPDGAVTARWRRLGLAFGDSGDARRVALALATPGASAARFVEAAEAEERAENFEAAARLFHAAAVAPEAALVAADVVAGQFRCGAVDTLWPAIGGRASPSDAERALVDVDALQDAVLTERWEDALGLLLDVPPHETEPGAQTWSFAASVAAARLTRKPELAERLWTRAQALAIRPHGDSGGVPADESIADGAPVLALFRAADAGAEPDPVRRARAQEMLAELAAAASRDSDSGGVSDGGGPDDNPADADRAESDRDSPAVFMWLAASADRFAASEGANRALDADPVETERRLRRSIEHASGASAAVLPAAIAWRCWLAHAGRTEEAAAAAAEEARALVDPELRVAAWLRAAALATAAIGETRLPPARAVSAGSAAAPALDSPEAYLHEALKIAPHHDEAFSRLREILASGARPRELAALLELRLGAIGDGEEATRSRLALSELFAGPLSDPARAKIQLAAILERDPHHREALSRLADLEELTGNAVGAADVLLCRSTVERSPAELCEIFLRLGRLYADQLDDPKRAVAAFHRVLDLDGGHPESLERLSRLYLALGDARNALVVTETLARVEPDARLRARHLLTIGRLREQLDDPRGALASFRGAVELAITDTTAMAELIRRLDKSHDANGRRFALDSAANRLRSALRGRPDDGEAADAMAAVMRWRGRPAAAAALSEWSAWLTRTTSLAEGPGGGPGWAPPSGAAAHLLALARPEIEDLIFADQVPASFRRLFRSLGALVWENEKRAVSSAGVDRGDRVAAGRPGRELWDQTARGLGAPAFDLHVLPASTRALAGSAHLARSDRLAVLPGRPPAIVVGTEIARPASGGIGAAMRSVEEAEAGVRFAAARSLYLIATGLDFAMSGDLADLATWLSAVIRQFIPDYLHPTASAEPVRERAARFSRLIPRRLRHDLMPFALECSGELDLEALRAGISDAINRVGLVASGHLTAAVHVILMSHGAAASAERVAHSLESRRLLEFAMSDAYDSLLAALEPPSDGSSDGSSGVTADRVFDR